MREQAGPLVLPTVVLCARGPDGRQDPESEPPPISRLPPSPHEPRADPEDPTRRCPGHLTTFNVTSILTTSPVTGSVEAIICAL